MIDKIPPDIIVNKIVQLVNLRKFDLPINSSLIATNKIIIRVKKINMFFKFEENSIT